MWLPAAAGGRPAARVRERQDPLEVCACDLLESRTRSMIHSDCGHIPALTGTVQQVGPAEECTACIRMAKG